MCTTADVCSRRYTVAAGAEVAAAAVAHLLLRCFYVAAYVALLQETDAAADNADNVTQDVSEEATTTTDDVKEST